MKNQTRTTERRMPYEGFAASCAACGATARRGAAKFCLVCGKDMRESYQPLDTLRAAHRLHGQNLAVREEPKSHATENLFAAPGGSIEDTAWACLVFSLVPYLGILFVPLTILIGGCGFYKVVRTGAGRNFFAKISALSLLVLAVQIFLWWLLYIVPERSRL